MLDHFIIFAFGNAEPQLYENSAQIQVRPLPDAMTESLVNYIVQNGQIAHVIYGASLFDALTAHAGKLERMEGTILILAIKHQFSVDKTPDGQIDELDKCSTYLQTKYEGRVALSIAENQVSDPPNQEEHHVQ